MRTKMILVAVATLLAAAEAHSVDRELAFQQNGAGACQAALPAYEGLIRKRPMALANEGAGTAFVTCAPVTLQGVSTSFGHGLYMVNNTASEVTVNCTGVQGARNGVADVSVPKSVVLDAGSNGSIYWEVDDGLDVNNGDSFNMSCGIPAGVGITTVYTNQLLDVGS